MADNELKRMESYQYPATHVGHLNSQQQASLENFKQICQQKGYFHPAGVDGRKDASHDDETMLRYLRARKFNPTEAFTQFKDTEDWRKENQLDKLYESIDLEEYESTRRLYPQWTGRRDRRGIPVYVFEVAHLNSKAVSAYETSTSSKTQSITSKVPTKMLRLFALYENLCNFVLPLCSAIPDRPYPETPVSQSSNIVDISKVGLKQFWNLKNHMQDASTLATAHYPETLDRIFIIGAPSFFPTVWGWIKRWFDPITVSKIFILSNANMRSTLEQYIAPENIPKKYGGLLDYNFGELPNIEPAIDANLQWTQPEVYQTRNTIPTGPIRWITNPDGTMTALAVGSENGIQRTRKIATLHSGHPSLSADTATTTTTNTQIYRTTSGISTHPPSPPASESLDAIPPPPSDTPSPHQGPDATGGAVPDASRAGTYTIPYRDAEPRAGTTHTRFEQQSHTHAAGQLADATPHYVDNGEGDKHGVMEPNTVGQAPKTHPVPVADEPEAAPGVVDQAKQVAGQAISAAESAAAGVMGAVGLGGAAKETETKAEEKEEQVVREDPAVDAAGQKNVEEFLRSQYVSHAKGGENEGSSK
ncbi:hypothetical protein M8818_000270 [Zalaria obscura]|uniref:Uncharacterized protein n=1 Tax=Zalaria obscura TaxID=2024903 RepID=A0ACC3SPR5_9PEZI